MSDIRSIEVWESEYDTNQLAASKYNFQIAKSVITADGTAVYNTVWQSQALQPDATVSWHVDYAFNWTKQLPSTGATIVIGGKWQACNKGQTVDIDASGYFSTPTTGGAAGWMNIGTNNFSPQSGGGINIVVGIKNAVTGKYDAIFVDPSVLFTGGNGQWQPQEEVKWWYATGLNTGTMFTKLQTKLATQDMTSPAPLTNKYYYSTTYTTDDGKWSISQQPPNLTFYAPLAAVQPDTNGYGGNDSGEVNTPMVNFWPVARGVLFSTAVAKAVQLKIQTQVTTDFQRKYKYVDISWVSNLKMNWNFGPPKDAAPNTMEALGATDPDITAIINTELNTVSSVPAGDTWTVGNS